METHSFLQDLYEHMEWADAQVWRAVLTSEAGAGDTVLNERLQHLHIVQRAFLDLWHERPIDIEAASGLQGADLASWARGFYGAARKRLIATTESQLDDIISMPWAGEVSERLGIEPAATSLRDTFFQVYAHTQHHRGQISLRLRELGETPPLIDFIVWVWSKRPVPDWP